jgi:hypothetical protein
MTKPITDSVTVSQFQATEPRDSQGQNRTAYRVPAIFVVGNAVDLLQSYSYGAYEDRYTGYKWNR